MISWDEGGESASANNPDFVRNCIMNIVYHFIITILCNSSPVPTGIMAPSLGMGVLIGRLYGHLMYNLG